MSTMVQITRASKLRALQAYGLRVKGLTYREIGARIKRREAGRWDRKDSAWIKVFHDGPLGVQAASSAAQKGARIVRRWCLVRGRSVPKAVDLILKH